MRNRLRRLLPTQEQIRNNRWLGWLGPRLHDAALWHWSRRGVALGVAIGLFFGLLIPLAQIPLSAVAAVAIRANLPAAAASTLVTNPLTLGPIYFGAYRLGARILGETPTTPESVPDATETSPEQALNAWQRTLKLGKPLFVGLAIVATATGLAGYVVVHLGWEFIRYCRRRGTDD